MKRPVKQILFWTPRVAGILFILFISIFALDVFGPGYSFWETLLALFMHLLPSIGLAIAVALAWRWEWIGAVLFGGFAIWYIAVMRGFPLSVYLLLAGIPFVVGILFAAGWIYRKEIRPAGG
jgi:lysylphosphatidylglycerol synthetase-like protein (DUF2156 family)